MCFGEKHSWFTFVFGAIFVGLGLYSFAGKSRDNLVICLMMGLVVLMQLWEALAWRGLCDLASWGGYLTIVLQIAPVILLIPSMLGTLSGKLATGLLILYYATVFIGGGKPRCILEDKVQIRYTWFDKWWQQLGYLIVMGVVPLLLMKDIKLALFWATVFYSSLLVTQYVYGYLDTRGSIWCYYGALCSVLLFIFLWLRDKKKI